MHFVRAPLIYTQNLSFSIPFGYILPISLINGEREVRNPFLLNFMDILTHALWTGAAYKTIAQKKKTSFNFRLAIFWGVFPDLFAFVPGFSWFFYNIFFGTLHLSDIPKPDALKPIAPPLFRLTAALYNISHSAIIFCAVFGIVLLILRRPVWELGGWFLHILIDIPTHSYRFYPTPIFWPLVGWKFNGFSWANPWFLVRAHLKNNGVTRRSPFARGEVVEDEAYRNMASPNDKPQPNGDRRSSQVFQCLYS